MRSVAVQICCWAWHGPLRKSGAAADADPVSIKRCRGAAPGLLPRNPLPHAVGQDAADTRSAIPRLERARLALLGPRMACSFAAANARGDDRNSLRQTAATCMQGKGEQNDECGLPHPCESPGRHAK